MLEERAEAGLRRLQRALDDPAFTPADLFAGRHGAEDHVIGHHAQVTVVGIDVALDHGADSSAGVTECANHALRALGLATAEPAAVRRTTVALACRGEERLRFGYMPEERGLYPKQPILDQLVYVAQLKGLGRVAARPRARPCAPPP